MNFKNIITTILIAIFALSSCKKQPIDPTPLSVPTYTVYAAGGTYSANSHIIATYWKDGVAVNLTDGSTSALINDIAVQGNDVYAVGYITSATTTAATYWKNGAAVTLANGGNALSIYINGSDIYVGGYSSGPNNSYAVATYWKNGVATPLSDGTSNAAVRNIVVQGGDVYASGYKTNSPYSVLTTAVYWKNGVAVSLPNNNGLSYTSGLVVQGTDVYVSASYTLGVDNSAEAIYWKNGVVIPPGNVVANFNPTSIAVQGSDVYMSGSIINPTNALFQTAAYVKNGVSYHLTDPSIASKAATVVISGTDIYIGGASTNNGQMVATYWKNGVPVTLSASQSYITSMAVVVK